MLNDDKQNIERFIAKAMRENKSKRVPNTENAGFDVYNNAWAMAIAVDMVDFKKVLSYYKRWAIIRIIQGFTNTVIRAAKKDNENFVDAYVNGDQVIVILRAETKSKIKDNLDTAILINSIVNYLFPTLMRENGYDKEVYFGIGLSLSSDNSLIKYGERKSIKHSFFTTMGTAINNASILSNIANRGYPQILMNNSIAYNLYDDKEWSKWIEKKWIKEVFLYDEEIEGRIWGVNIRYNEYANYGKNK